jgi:hypothetical protein
MTDAFLSLVEPDMEISPHPALARVGFSRERSQLDQSHMLEMSIEANSLTHPPATLTAAAQVFAQEDEWDEAWRVGAWRHDVCGSRNLLGYAGLS